MVNNAPLSNAALSKLAHPEIRAGGAGARLQQIAEDERIVQHIGQITGPAAPGRGGYGRQALIAKADFFHHVIIGGRVRWPPLICGDDVATARVGPIAGPICLREIA
jgi:hypothetical protein